MPSGPSSRRLLNPEDEDTTIHRKFGKYIPLYTSQKTLKSSATPLWGPLKVRTETGLLGKYLKCEVSPYMPTCVYGEWDIAPLILKLGNIQTLVLSFMPRSLLPRGKSPRYPLNWRLGGPQRQQNLPTVWGRGQAHYGNCCRAHAPTSARR